MSIAEHLKLSFDLPDMIVNGYLADLTDEELLVRPTENANHIAWQLGHLIHGENFHMNQLAPDSMPPLPEGFSERHTKETAAQNESSDFLSKAEYLELMQQQRAGTLEVLGSLSDEQLMQPSPESMRYFGPTVGSVFSGEAVHWVMHAGQWAIIRRKLGKPPLF